MAVEITEGANTYKIPNPMTYSELINEGKSPEQAHRIMHEKVFGVNYAKDANGAPIEMGLGGPLQQTQQHKDALKVAEDRAAMAGKATNAQADIIAAAVSAGVQAGLKAAKEGEF